MVCASLWLPGIPETPRFLEEQPPLGTVRRGRVINRCKARGGFDRGALVEAQNDLIIHLFFKPTSYFGDLLIQNKLVQTVMPATAKVIREIRVI